MNKKAQTAERDKAGGPLRIDDAYSLHDGGGFRIDSKIDNLKTNNQEAEANEVPATHADTDQLWYKDAIIYQLHVKAFADSNNDGIGDFAGLTEKLGYLQDSASPRCGYCRSIPRRLPRRRLRYR